VPRLDHPRTGRLGRRERPPGAAPWVAGSALLGLTVCLLIGTTTRAQDQEDPAVPPPEQKTPLRLLFDKFQQTREMAEEQVDDSPPIESTSSTRDPIDARAPCDPRLESIWMAAQEAIARQDWKSAIERLQTLLDLPDDAVLLDRTAPAGQSRGKSLRVAAGGALAAAPAAVLADYERQYGGLARQLFATARRTHSVAGLVDVATRFPATQAGREAARLLAVWHFDQSEFALAYQGFRAEWDRGAVAPQDAVWRLQAAYAARQVGNTSVEKEWLGELLTAGMPPIPIGGHTLTPEQWWDAHGKTASLANQSLSNWLHVGGTPSRTGKGSPGEPLLLAEWAALLTNSPVIQQTLSGLVRDLSDNGVSAIPVGSPLVIGQRIAFRDLRGVRVVDAATGKTLWETAEGISPERILNGQPAGDGPRDEAWHLRVNARQLHEEYLGESSQSHPLASWLYRDAVSNQISSDGRRLFVLEDVAVMTRNQAGYQWEGDDQAPDPFGADWSSNRLSAYDLATGRLAWTVGGPAAAELQPVPLAGTFFLGAPVVDGGELYVIATRGEEIRLHALDPDSGRPLWSQLLAYADTKIELDVVRRWIGATPSVSQGVVVCPTGVGWLVAVDRLRRQLLWAARYQTRDPDEDFGDPASHFLPQRELNESWSQGPPVIHRSHVYFAPPESDRLLCLNLVDGRIVWQRPRLDGIAIVGATDLRVLVLNRTGVWGFDLLNERSRFQSKFPEGVHPTGRPAWLGTQVAVPLSDGQVWLVDHEIGRVAARWKLAAGQPPLENLVKVGDRLLSFGLRGCRAFRDREPALAELAARKAKSPDDPATVLQQAEWLLLDRRWEDAVAELRRPDSDAWPEALQERRWTILWEALEARFADDPSSTDTALRELDSLARTDEQRWRLAMRQVDRRLQENQPAEAFEQLWRMTRQSGPEFLSPSGDPALTIRREQWLRGRLFDLWSDAGPELKRQIDERMRQLVDRTLAGPIDDWLALGGWSEFHPQTARVSWALAEAWTKTREFARAEGALSRWLSHPAPAISVESRVRLADVLRQFQLNDDAAMLVDELSEQDARQRLSSGETAAGFIARRKLLQTASAPVSAEALVRRRQPLVPQRTMTSYAASVQSVSSPIPWPSLRRQTIQIDPQEQRLTVQDRQTGEWLWLAPLRTSARSEDSGSVPVAFLGHRLLILHRQVLHLVSPFERKLVWTQSLARDSAGGDHGFTQRLPRRLIDPADDYLEEYGLLSAELETGAIALANEDVVVLTGRRRITAHDPRTGRELWRRDGLPGYSTILGSQSHVFVVDDVTSAATAYRAFDGQRIDMTKLDERLQRTLAFQGDDCITLEAGKGLRLFNLSTSRTLLRRVDPVSLGERWQIAFKPQTSVGLLAPGLAIAVQPAENRRGALRPVTLIDLETGAQRSLTGLPTRGDSYHAFCDADRIYLIAEDGGSGHYHYGDSLAALDVSGELFVWDRHTGDRLWQRTVDELNLVFDRFADTPLLIFLARNWETLGSANFTKLRLLLLDKQTGAVLHESEGPSLFAGFHGVEISAPDETVELTSYNLRLKFVPATAEGVTARP
jgi:outer membrane protein assembly factor BamB